MNNQQALSAACLAISELVAMYKKDAENWPENLPNYYLQKSEELTTLYLHLTDWQVELIKEDQE